MCSSSFWTFLRWSQSSSLLGAQWGHCPPPHKILTYFILARSITCFSKNWNNHPPTTRCNENSPSNEFCCRRVQWHMPWCNLQCSGSWGSHLPNTCSARIQKNSFILGRAKSINSLQTSLHRFWNLTRGEQLILSAWLCSALIRWSQMNWIIFAEDRTSLVIGKALCSSNSLYTILSRIKSQVISVHTI